MSEFKLKYHQDMNDILAYSYSYYRTSHVAYFARKQGVMVLFLLLFIYSCYKYLRYDESVPFQVSFTFLTLFLFLLTFRVKRIYRLLYWHKFTRKKNEPSLGEVEIMLTEQIVFAKSNSTNGNCKWNDFKFYIDDKNYFFLYHNENSGLIIPKRIFLLDQEQYDVKTFIERKLAEQKH